MTQPGGLTCDEVRDLAPLFVVGALDADEADAVREHLAGCAEPHQELMELGEAATAMLESVEPVTPPPALKARLMGAATADLASGAHPSVRASAPIPAAVSASSEPIPAATAHPAPAAPASAPSEAPIDLGAERARRRPRLAWLVAVAAVILVVVLGASNLALRRDLDSAQAYQQGVDQALALAGQAGSVAALLTAEGGTATGIAVIGADGTTEIAMRGLPATSGSQVYTAWSIEGEAAPVSVGDFTVGANGLATTTGAAPAATPGAVVAITLEPVGGAVAPAGPIVASGTTGTTSAPAG